MATIDAASMRLSPDGQKMVDGWLDSKYAQHDHHGDLVSLSVKDFLQISAVARDVGGAAWLIEDPLFLPLVYLALDKRRYEDVYLMPPTFAQTLASIGLGVHDLLGTYVSQEKAITDAKHRWIISPCNDEMASQLDEEAALDEVNPVLIRDRSSKGKGKAVNQKLDQVGRTWLERRQKQKNLAKADVGLHWGFMLIDKKKREARWFDGDLELSAGSNGKRIIQHMYGAGRSAGKVLLGYEAVMKLNDPDYTPQQFSARTLKYVPNDNEHRFDGDELAACGPWVFAMVEYLFNHMEFLTDKNSLSKIFAYKNRSRYIQDLQFDSRTKRLDMQDIIRQAMDQFLKNGELPYHLDLPILEALGIINTNSLRHLGLAHQSLSRAQPSGFPSSQVGGGGGGPPDDDDDDNGGDNDAGPSNSRTDKLLNNPQRPGATVITGSGPQSSLAPVQTLDAHVANFDLMQKPQLRKFLQKLQANADLAKNERPFTTDKKLDSTASYPLLRSIFQKTYSSFDELTDAEIIDWYMNDYKLSPNGDSEGKEGKVKKSKKNRTDFSPAEVRQMLEKRVEPWTLPQGIRGNRRKYTDEYLIQQGFLQVVQDSTANDTFNSATPEPATSSITAGSSARPLEKVRKEHSKTPIASASPNRTSPRLIQKGKLSPSGSESQVKRQKTSAATQIERPTSEPDTGHKDPMPSVVEPEGEVKALRRSSRVRSMTPQSASSATGAGNPLKRKIPPVDTEITPTRPGKVVKMTVNTEQTLAPASSVQHNPLSSVQTVPALPTQHDPVVPLERPKSPLNDDQPTTFATPGQETSSDTEDGNNPTVFPVRVSDHQQSALLEPATSIEQHKASSIDPLTKEVRAISLVVPDFADLSEVPDRRLYAWLKLVPDSIKPHIGEFMENDSFDIVWESRARKWLQRKILRGNPKEFKEVVLSKLVSIETIETHVRGTVEKILMGNLLSDVIHVKEKNEQDEKHNKDKRRKKGEKKARLKTVPKKVEFIDCSTDEIRWPRYWIERMEKIQNAQRTVHRDEDAVEKALAQAVEEFGPTTMINAEWGNESEDFDDFDDEGSDTFDWGDEAVNDDDGEEDADGV